MENEGRSRELGAFGGSWTKTKLDALVKYLNAYMTIMGHNPKAKKHFRTTYVDAFAGSGRLYAKDAAPAAPVLEGLEDFAENDVQEFYKGSARLALELKEPFDRYVFVDTSEDAVSELDRLRTEYGERAIEVVRGDANAYLREFCAKMKPTDRAVVFLDPFGMQTDWSTIEVVARTKKIDLWALVPVGQAVVRMMPTGAFPPPQWSAKLSRFLGSEDWRNLYSTRTKQTLFGPEESVARGGLAQIQNYIVARWKTVFAGVLETPIVLRNSNNCPLYMLCFGVSNPRAVKAALSIATDLARGFNDGG